MFRSKKKKEQQEIARAEAAAARQEALAAFEKRVDDIATIKDVGEKLFALDQLKQDAANKILEEKAKLYTEAGSNVVMNAVMGSGGLVIGGILAAMVGAWAAPVILPVAFGVAAGGFGTMLVSMVGSGALERKIEKSVENKRKEAGLYEEEFVQSLTAIGEKAEAEVQDILRNQYEAVAASKVFVKVAETYPEIREAFTKQGLKAAKNKAPVPAVLSQPSRNQQDFTL